MLRCGCGGAFQPLDVEEISPEACWARLQCSCCLWSMGVEGDPKALSHVVEGVIWTQDALHELSRLPPYLAPLVREQVEESIQARAVRLVTFDGYQRARAGGAMAWEPEAERRLERVPAAVRGMARVELERTAAERGEPAVTVALMEEVKARYFGMGKQEEVRG